MPPTVKPIACAQVIEPKDPARASLNLASITELGESIRAIGLLHPIVVVDTPEGYVLRAGQRRLKAHQWIGRDMIMATVYPADEDPGIEGMLAENIDREDMTIMDECRMVTRVLGELSGNLSATGRRLGKTVQWVRTRLDIINWPENFQLAIAQDKIGLGAARWLLKIEDEPIRDRFLAFALKDGLTEHAAESWWQQWRANAEAAAIAGVAIEPESLYADPPTVTFRCWACRVPHERHQLLDRMVCRSCVTGIENVIASATTKEGDNDRAT